MAHFTTTPEEGKLFTITFELVGVDVDHRQQINTGGSIEFTDLLPDDPPDFPRTDLSTFTTYPEVPRAGVYRIVAAVDGTKAETTVRIVERPAAASEPPV